MGQSQSLHDLVRLLHGDNQLGVPEEAALRLIDLLPGKGEQFRVRKGCRLYITPRMKQRKLPATSKQSSRLRLLQLALSVIPQPLLPRGTVLRRTQA